MDYESDGEGDVSSTNSIIDYQKLQRYQTERLEARKLLTIEPNKLELEVAEAVTCLPLLSPQMFSQKTGATSKQQTQQYTQAVSTSSSSGSSPGLRNLKSFRYIHAIEPCSFPECDMEGGQAELLQRYQARMRNGFNKFVRIANK